MGSDAWWQGHLEQVLFACLTNRRRWVFHSETRGAAGLAREAGAFYGCRPATGAVDWAMMFVLAERMREWRVVARRAIEASLELADELEAA